jgi:hypothetical protein
MIVEQLREIEARPVESFGMWWVPLRALEPVTAIGENIGYFHHTGFHSARERDDLGNLTFAIGSGGGVNNKVDATGHRRQNKVCRNICTSQQRQRAQLGYCLTCGISVQRGHRRHSAIHGNEQIE